MQTNGWGILIGSPDVSTEYHTKYCKNQKAYKNKNMNYGEALAAKKQMKEKAVQAATGQKSCS